MATARQAVVPMTVPDVGAWLNDEHLRTWAEHSPSVSGRCLWPLLYPEGSLQSERILFVGLNPSFNVDCPRRYDWTAKDPNPGTKEVILQEERKALGLDRSNATPYRYYLPMKGMADNLGCGWSHMDLLPVRETSQQKLQSEWRLDPAEERWYDLTALLIDLFIDGLRRLKPLVIVVANALASSLLKQRLPLDAAHFPPNGYDTVDLGGQYVPILFGGMLSGQRALDVHSRRRLEWHVGRAMRESRRSS